MELMKNKKMKIGRTMLILMAVVALSLTPLLSYADTEDVVEKDNISAEGQVENNADVQEPENKDDAQKDSAPAEDQIEDSGSTQNSQITEEEESVDGTLEELPEEDPLLRSGTASQYNTWILDGKDDTWKQNNTSNNKVGNLKETDRSVYTVRTAAKTMYTAPFFRLVDSDGKVRSKVITLPEENTTYTGENNGKKGQKYYASLKPSPNQMNKDSITLKFNPQ